MSTGRHRAPDSRSAFNSLRKMPSTLFRSDKPGANDTLPPKKPRRRALASFLGRKSPPETEPQTKQRPSCGPDPFVRPEAPSVRLQSPPPELHALTARHPSPQPQPFPLPELQTQCKTRTSSVRGERPNSMRGLHTVHIDDVDCLDDPLIDDITPSTFEKAHRLALGAALLPARHSSLLRPKTSQLDALAEDEEPAPTEPSEQPEPSTIAPPPAVPEGPPKPKSRLLSKEKTRSRVWGVLTGKRMSRTKAAPPSPPPALPSQLSGRTSMSRPSGRTSVSQAPARTSVPQPGGRLSTSHTAGHSSVTQLGRPVSQFRPPTLHVTHPSQDGELPPPIPTCHFVNDPDSPFISQKKTAPPKTTSILVSRQSTETMLTRSPSAATSRKSMPKRKSLAGIFGITFKRSADALPAESPAPPVPPIPEPSTPSPMSITANAMDDTSPDTLAFYSRHGARTGFNLHGNLLYPDVNIHDVTSATHHLHDLVTTMDGSFSIPSGCREPGTPTPLRRARSGTLKVVNMPSPRTGRSSAPPASPSKGFAHSIGRVFEGSLRPTTPARSPVKSMVQSVRNRIVGSPDRRSIVSSYLGRPDSVASDMSDISAASSCNIPVEIGRGADNRPKFRPALDVPQSVREGPSPESMRTAEQPPSHPPSAFSFGHTRIGSQPPILDLEFGSRPSSMLSDILGQFNVSKSSRASDRSLVQSTRSSQRTTFDFAAELAALTATAGDSGPISDTLLIARSIEFSTESPDTALAQLEEVLESRKNSVETLRGRNRRSNPPFQGRIEFQMGLRARNSSRPPPGPLPPFALPPTPEGLQQQDLQDHKKQPSAISFASMSSLGAPLAHIDRGHVSYFEQAFASGAAPPPLPALPPMPKRFGGAHHRHMSSGVSVDSVLSAEISMITGRMSRGHRRESSTGSTVGRSDWASQRRASRDSDSMARHDSIARLGRPGLGERMFEGIDDSDSHEPEGGVSLVARPTFGTRPYSFASSTNETVEPATEEGVSFFGNNLERKNSFAIKSRPISLASFDESYVNDTFDFVDGPSKRGAVEVGIVDAYASSSEASQCPRLTPGPAPAAATLTMRDLPQPRARHRPPALYLCDGDDDTPGLISPSDLTEVSSLFSLDTSRASNPPPGYPSHRRDKGSITSIVQVHPTIREEASQKTLRETRGSDDTRVAWELVDEFNARHWNDLSDVVASLLTRSPHVSFYSSSSPGAPPVPHTRSEIEDILAESRATYRPIAESAKTDKPHGLHRRKTSLHDTRAAVAPYVLQPAPLETRFRSKRSSGESVSPLLAEFARDVSPLPRVLSTKQPQLQCDSEVKASTARAPPGPETRTRVPSHVRRDNLGWARRRNSDEPTGSAPAVAPKAPVSATLGSFPSFLTFSPAPPPTHVRPGAPTTRVSSRPTHPRPLLTAKIAPVPKRVQQKRTHVKTDSKGSPMSLHSTSSRTCLTSRPGGAPSAPLTARPSNIPKPRRVQKTKSSPEIRRTHSRSRNQNKENARAHAPSFVLAPPPLRV